MILPDACPVLIAQVTEPLVLVAAAAPDPKHIRVRLRRSCDHVSIVIAGHARWEPVGGNPVRALGEDRHSVDTGRRAQHPCEPPGTTDSAVYFARALRSFLALSGDRTTSAARAAAQIISKRRLDLEGRSAASRHAMYETRKQKVESKRPPPRSGEGWGGVVRLYAQPAPSPLRGGLGWGRSVAHTARRLPPSGRAGVGSFGCAHSPPPPRFGEGWGGVRRLYAQPAPSPLRGGLGWGPSVAHTARPLPASGRAGVGSFGCAHSLPPPRFGEGWGGVVRLRTQPAASPLRGGLGWGRSVAHTARPLPASGRAGEGSFGCTHSPLPPRSGEGWGGVVQAPAGNHEPSVANADSRRRGARSTSVPTADAPTRSALRSARSGPITGYFAVFSNLTPSHFIQSTTKAPSCFEGDPVPPI